MASRFRVIVHFETIWSTEWPNKCTEWPQRNTELAVKSTVPLIYPFYILMACQVQIFNLFHPTASRFWVTHHFETSTELPQNDMKMKCTLYIRCISVHGSHTIISDSQISLRFTLRSFSSCMPLWRNLQWITPKWPWILQGHWYPILVYFLLGPPQVLNFNLLCTDSCFRVTGYFLTSASTWMTSKWPKPLQGRRTPIYTLQLLPGLKFHFVSL